MAIAKVKDLGSYQSGIASGLASYTITVPAGGVAVGNCVVLFGITSRDIISVTDSRGNSYAIRLGLGSGTFWLVDGVVTTALQAGDVITITRSSTGVSWGIAVEYSGIVAYVGANATNGAGTTTVSGGTVAARGAGDLLLGVFWAFSAFALGGFAAISTPGSGYTNEAGLSFAASDPDAGRSLDWESKLSSAAGSEIATATLSKTSSSWLGLTAAYSSTPTQSPIGPIFPTSRYSVVGAGTVNWTTPGNIGADDGVLASVDLPNSSVSYTLAGRYINPSDFEIPTGSTIDGIVVELNDANINASATGPHLWLCKTASATAVAQAGTGKYITAQAGWRTYGSSTDKWGLTWTPADINGGNFAVRIVSSADLFGAGIDSLDAVRVTVYFTPPTQLSKGPMVPTSRFSNSGEGTTAWTNPGNIGPNDEVVASVTLASLGNSQILAGRYINASDFGIPATATITGIIVEVGTRSFFSNSNLVGLSKACSATVAPLAGAAKSMASGVGWATYGSPTDLWGTTWTPADFNSTNFAARIRCIDQGDGGGTFTVDAVRVSVFYTLPSDNPVSMIV